MKIAKKISAILADDIRREEGNKHSIIGTYGRTIILPKIPATLTKLCLYVMIEELQKAVPRVTVEVKIPANETKKIELHPLPEILVGNDVNIVLEMYPIKITEPGNATIEFFFGDERKPSFVHKFSLRQADQTKE